MAKGDITLYKGKAKKDGKPFTALRLSVGEWDALYFPQSKFEMKYIEDYLNGTAPTSAHAPVAPGSDPLDLHEDPQTVNKGMFD